MIAIEEFIVRIENEFDEIEPGTVSPDKAIEDTIELSSLNMLLVMAFIKTEYDRTIAAKDISRCRNYAELYALIAESTKA